MTTWQFLLSVAEPAAAGTLVAILLWAAIHRAKVHRWWRGLCATIGTVVGCA